MTGQNPGGARDAANAAAGALGQTQRSGPRQPSNLRKAARLTGNALFTTMVLVNRVATAAEYLGKLVAGQTPTTGPRPQAYQPQRAGQRGGGDLGHYAPEADPTSPHAYGHPHGQGWAHGPQTAHHSGPTMGR